MAALTDQARLEALDLLRGMLPGVDDAGLGAHLAAATATQARVLRQLAEHLRAHPDALISGSPRCPAVWVRLTHVLFAAGHRFVVRPGCARCAAVTVALGRVTSAGRICLRCHQRANPPRHEPCASCGRMAKVTARAADGSPRCRGCHGRTTIVCLGCGRHRQPRKITDDGGYCAACYTPGHRPCGRCGQTRKIAKRADANGPDICESCYRGRQATCSHCGQHRPCQRITSGAPICAACQHRARPPRTCARCANVKKVQAIWPIGPVCGACYVHVRKHPVACHRCGVVAPAIGRAPDGAPWCPSCAGTPVDYTCRGCGAQGAIYANHRCHRCTLTTRARALLTGPDGHITAQLQPLMDVLSTVDNPESTLMWINNGAAARLLASLATSDQPITHDLLDAYPHTNAAHHLREILVGAAILPTRDEHLARLDTWIRTTLPTIPADHAQYVTPFAHWNILRRARRRAASTTLRHTAADHARASIRRALDLLAWLDQRHTPLPKLTQPLLEQWADQVTNPDQIRPFLTWLRNRRLISEIRLPTTKRNQPTVFLPEDDRVAQLNRCLHEPALPLDVRVAGAITLLYGIMVERIAYLTKQDVHDTTVGTFLTIGDHQLQLPPALADLTRQLRDHIPSEAALARHGMPPWLFVGRATSRPTHPHYLAAKLTQHGIQTHAGRNTARLALAAELPASVLADLTNTSISSATQWTAWAKRDWNDYIATRATTNTAPQE